MAGRATNAQAPPRLSNGREFNTSHHATPRRATSRYNKLNCYEVSQLSGLLPWRLIKLLDVVDLCYTRHLGCDTRRTALSQAHVCSGI